MLLDDAPGNQLLWLIFACLCVQPLREAVFHFAGVGQRGIAVKSDEIGEIVHTGHVPVGDGRLDRVLETSTCLVFLKCRLEKSTEIGGTQLHSISTSARLN